ncbi:MAG: hypothetical protein BMS9Abin14_311 [Gammaproteobacteria bacterium]|nr:MAG: hypothetical protein BMS9Abin14_311 [Gammaproteobacteria bacterium]
MAAKGKIIITCATTGSIHTPSNAEQVTIIRSVIENLSLQIASPAEAREMLDLKGGDQVSF